MNSLKEFIGWILIIPNLPVITILVLFNRFTENREDIADVIADKYPKWLYVSIGIFGWIWFFNLIF